jgi:hypothetical protein
MTFAKRQARMRREHPITNKHQLWAAWFLGAASFYHPDQVRAPVHPDTSREFYAGRDAAAGGYIRVPDIAEAFELARHVKAGNAPNTYRPTQITLLV